MNDHRCLEDIIIAIDAIKSYAPESYKEFLSDDQIQDAIMCIWL